MRKRILNGSEVFVTSNLDFTTPSHHFCEPSELAKCVFTPLDEAIQEINRRRTDKKLLARVEKYLNSDIPEYLKGEKPVLYLARFIATPNYEFMLVRDIAKENNLPLVVSEDHKSRFTPQNPLKRTLGKLPVIKGLSHNADEITENFTIIDFNHTNHKPIAQIETVFGDSLLSFHRQLIAETGFSDVTIVDDSDWIDRNFRSNIFEQYKRMFALMCVYGVMLESFLPGEHLFLQQVMYPAFIEVEREIGVRPLMAEHISSELEVTRNWESYPSVFYKLIKDRYEGK